MKNIQRFLTYSIFASITAFAFYSCEDDDICTDEGEVPRLVADMYYTGTTTKLEDTIYYWSYRLADTIKNLPTDTIKVDSGNVQNKTTFGMALRNNNYKKMIYKVAQGRDVYVRDSINKDKIISVKRAKRDILVLTYDAISNSYTSKACGFGITFSGTKVELVKRNGNTNWIKNIETVNTEIKDGSTTIIKLFADPRK